MFDEPILPHDNFNKAVNTKLNAEILLGDDWQDIAYAELLRLTLGVNAYHVQLRDKPGYEETGAAYTALQSACDALMEAANEPRRQSEPSGRLV